MSTKPGRHPLGPLKTLRRLLGVALLVIMLWQCWYLLQVLWWREYNPVTTRFMEIRLEELQARQPEAQLRHTWVDYVDISIHLKRAVVAAEDDLFMEHGGFDWVGIQNAIERNRERGRVSAGGSTITQQLAKNLFLSPAKSYLRKAQEAVITLMIETLWSKRRILEVYLNVVEWGEGIFGCEAAAQRFYGISAHRLNPSEAARLAVRLPNPRRYEKNFSTRLAQHAARIQARMARSQIP